MKPTAAAQQEQVNVVTSRQAAEVLNRTPQGTLAWDPEYARYLLWLATQGPRP